MSLWSLRWHFTNKSVTGAPYSIKSYSLSAGHYGEEYDDWNMQCRLEVAAELQQRRRRTNRRRKSIPRSSSSHREGSSPVLDLLLLTLRRRPTQAFCCFPVTVIFSAMHFISSFYPGNKFSAAACHPDHLRPAGRPFMGRHVSTSDSWGIKGNTTWCISSRSVVSWNKLVSGWGL